MTEISTTEYAALVKRLEERRKAVARLKADLAEARTLSEKIAIKREIEAARSREV